MTNLLEEQAAGSRRGRRRAPSPAWESIWKISPAEAEQRMRHPKYEDGTGGALPRRFRNHRLLWWLVPQRDRKGTMHSRYVTVGRRREEDESGVRFPAYFWCIETTQPLDGKRELTKVSLADNDLHRLIQLANRAIPGNGMWTFERQDQACDEAALMIAHRLGVDELYGCEGVQAAIIGPSIVEVTDFNHRARKLGVPELIEEKRERAAAAAK
ncbi:MAG: hypothetical protein QOI31_1717 [Solirubrobacterales bacterium]|jgi:hypothetical protein|nr:hypothetical protein [Solirubrobacterales bacterium]